VAMAPATQTWDLNIQTNLKMEGKMRYRKLGNTGYEVSEVGMGTWAIGGVSWRGKRPSGWDESWG